MTLACGRAFEDIRRPFAIEPSHDRAFRVGWSVAAHAMNSAQVAAQVSGRFPWVAASNTRIAFEHAFVAQWIYLTPGGPEHFMRHASHSNLTRAQELWASVEAEPALTEELDSDDLSAFRHLVAREAAPGKERSWNLRNLFSRFDSSGLLYGSYRSLSAATHPSVGTIAAHLEVSGSGNPRTRRAGDTSSYSHEAAQSLALAALWALNFVEKCQADHEPPGRAGEIAAPARLPHDLEHSDRGTLRSES